jgi:hypothetical protein
MNSVSDHSDGISGAPQQLRKRQPMHCVVIRTKLQAIIVREMVEIGLISGNVHLVQFYQDADDASKHDLEHQARGLESVTGKTTVISRSGAGMPGLFLYFMYLLWSARLRGHRVYFANINWFPFALALKLCPGQAVFTFDDGSANIQQRDSSYLSQAPSRRPGPGGWLARRIFPEGCASFVRGRIQRHCTIYPEAANIVPDSRLDTIRIDWDELLSDSDRNALPMGVRRIVLGSVYQSIARPSGPLTERDIEQARQWADLYIPHPRDAAARNRADAFVKYPAESIISHYAKSADVVVAHYNSSAALSFRNHPHVHLVNLMAVPTSILWETPEA